MKQQNPFSKSQNFERAVRMILRPLVRAMIAQGVTAKAFQRIVKRTYVEVAAEDSENKATDSKISLVTGVHRRDVRTFRTPQREDPGASNSTASFLATVVGRWLSDPAYIAANGTPRSLSRSSDAEPGFDSLVSGISQDIRPRTVLDELARQGIVQINGQMIDLHASAFASSTNLEQKLQFFSVNLTDHMSAAVENLLSETSPFLERAVFYNNLTEKSAQQIEEDARQAAETALLNVNAKARKMQILDEDSDGSKHRFRFGVYVYREEEQLKSTQKGQEE